MRDCGLLNEGLIFFVKKKRGIIWDSLNSKMKGLLITKGPKRDRLLWINFWDVL
jgi:hypothetical protein